MADWITIIDFINEGFSQAFFTGFAGGVLISSVVMMIRAAAAIFKHIVRS